MHLSPSPTSSLASSTTSRLSFLSTTSSNSTFSDYSVTSLPSPPHSASKTHAFFASPFPTRPPSPLPNHTSFFNHHVRCDNDLHHDVPTPTISRAININIVDTTNQSTPRPKELEPSLSQLWNSTTQPVPDPGEPHPGHIISSSTPPTITSPVTPTPSSLSPPQPSASTSLRLVRTLGHGAFSSVWLADDLSPVPLALRSRRSLRDLRRQASQSSSTGGPKPNLLSASLSLSRAGSLSTLRKRVPGTRPIYGRRGTREKVDGRSLYLDESHGQMGTHPMPPLDHDRKFDPVALVHRGAELPSSLSRSSSASSTSSFSRNRNVSLSISIEEPVRPGGELSRNVSTSSRKSGGSGRGRSAKGRLVAVKMTLRGGASVGMGGNEAEREEREKEKERTRVAFVREVEVLRHISHPNITPLLTHLSTPTHHVLVLPYLPGGDLLALVNSDSAWSQLRESVLRRIWCEICRAIGWMHGVGLVHRDVKLENILLTTPIFAALAQTQTPTPNSYTDTTTTSPVSDSDTPTSTRAPTLDDLPPPPAPLIKLTDFGLSRFVDIRTEEEKRRDREARRRTRRQRMTRTASEASTGDSSADEEDKNRFPLMEERPRGVVRVQAQAQAQAQGLGEDAEEEEEEEEYEGPLLSTRCGSEAYAAPELVMGGGRAAGKGVYDARETDAWACGVVLYALVGRRLPFGEGVGMGAGAGIKGEGAGRGVGPSGRRQWLMRIARGEYEWPAFEGEEGGGGEELIGKRLVESEGARRIVEKLLMRDPRKRVRVGELWGDEWMSWGEDSDADGGGREGKLDMDVRGDVVDVDRIHGHGHGHEQEQEHAQDHDLELDRDGEYDFCHPDPDVSEEEEELETEMEMEMAELEEEEEHADGWLVDQDGIASIARREVV